jgi:hypothetical protein
MTLFPAGRHDYFCTRFASGPNIINGQSLAKYRLFFFKNLWKIGLSVYIQAYVGEVEVASGTFDVGPWREGIFFIDAGIGSHSVGSSRSVITNGNR